MTTRSMKQDDPLDDFERRAIALDGVTRQVHVAGSGPAVIVMADTDARALAVARTLAKASPHNVYAVKGGFLAWRSVEVRLQAQASKPGSKYTFVVPFNTCEQGKPLHVFEAKPARPAMSTPK